MNLKDTHPYDAQVLKHLRSQAVAVEAAVRESVREALLMYKRIGNRVATWEDGRVVWIAPEDFSPDESGS